MKVKELLQKLEGLDLEKEIIISDGNKTSPLSSVTQSHPYIAENTWSGDLINPEDLEEMDPDGTESTDVVVFWPTF